MLSNPTVVVDEAEAAAVAYDEFTDDLSLASCGPSGPGLKQWFTQALSPTFKSKTGALLEAESGDEQALPLDKARALIRRNSLSFNRTRRPSDKLHPALTRWFAPLQSGSLRTCSSALVASSLGTGILSLPFAFSLCGLLLGLATLTLAAVAAALSLQILILASRYTETKSYAELMELAVGRRCAGMAVDITVLTVCAGAISCYLIFEGDFVPSVLSPLWLRFGFSALTRTQAILGVAVCAWPLTLPAELSSLRYVTVASPIVLLGTTAAVLSQAPVRFEVAEAAGGELELWNFDLAKWLQAVSIMLAAFTNQQMAVAAGAQLDNPSLLRIVKTTTNATAVSWGIYAVIGVGGYMSWLGATKGNFIENYPQDSLIVWSCRAMLALSLYFVIPVVCMPSARSLLQLLLACIGADPNSMTPKMHAASATAVLLSATFVAVNVKDVASVIGLLGGICATLLMFWFPAIVFVKVLYPVQPKYLRCFVLAILIFCGILGTTTVPANLQKLFATN